MSLTHSTEIVESEKKKKPSDIFRDTLVKQRGEFVKVLPQHISFEKFQRTVMTAVITNPDLLKADRQSLLVSCIKSATDGLLPDGRDSALVPFNTKIKDASGADVFIQKVQYMPMYAGILKKIRQSNELASVVTHVVYQRDKFEYVLGDEEKIIHEPYMGAEDRGSVIAAYCIARLKDGTIVREVMTFQDIEKVRKSSKAGAISKTDLKYNKNAKIGDPKGIWLNWYEEMARKTVFRKCAKWLPQQIELVDQVFNNDDSMEVMSAIDADPEVLIEGDSSIEQIEKQPDLKKEIENQRDQTETENVSHETNSESLTTIEQILKDLEEAPDGGAVYAIWTKIYAEDLKPIKQNNPQAYSQLFNAYQKAAERFQEE